jgi:UDP-glucose:glycoprotein glucosyltransferase
LRRQRILTPFPLALQLQITAIVDPISEAAQRISSLLIVIRDNLKLPLRVLLAPAQTLDGDAKVPISSYYRFVADPSALTDANAPQAVFSNLPTNHVLTLQVDVPEPWNVQQTSAAQDTDNIVCDVGSGCGDQTHSGEVHLSPIHKRDHVTTVEYGLKNLLIFGQCYDATTGSAPNGLQLTLTRAVQAEGNLPVSGSAELGMDGSITSEDSVLNASAAHATYSDTLVMKNVGYWQLPANPGVWTLEIAASSKGSEIFEMVDGSLRAGRIYLREGLPHPSTRIVMKDFASMSEVLIVQRRKGYEKASLFHDEQGKSLQTVGDDDVIHVFSLATGHLYERFLKIMMLSVTKRTSSKVKFWLFENFLSPTFKSSARAMADRIGCDVEFVTYKWPEWLRGQSEKQRIIWGYKVR